MKTPIYAVAGAAVLSFLVVGCGSDPASESSETVGSSRAALVTEGMLGALGESDYTRFSENFRPELKQALSLDNFEAIDQRLKESSGGFVSAGEPVRVPTGGSYVEYRTTATFEREDVDVWIWFEPPSQLALGVFFDSPGLRGDDHSGS